MRNWIAISGIYDLACAKGGAPDAFFSPHPNHPQRYLLQVDPAEVRYADGAVWGPQGSVTVDEIAKVAHLRMDGLPPGVDPLLDATATYEPSIGTGVFSYATHGAVVAVDPVENSVEE